MAYQHYFGLFRTRLPIQVFQSSEEFQEPRLTRVIFTRVLTFAAFRVRPCTNASTQLTVMEYAPSSAVIPMIDIFHASATIINADGLPLPLSRTGRSRGGKRLIAVNTIGTKTVVLLVLIGFIYERPLFLDISIVYAMINFIATLAIAKYLGRGHIC